MNWNLVWTNETNTSKTEGMFDSKFIFYFGDEPVLTKRMYGQIYRTENDAWLTFVENSHKFSFEDFNEFIMDFEKSSQAKIKFNAWDGEVCFNNQTCLGREVCFNNQTCLSREVCFNNQTCLGREEAFAYDSDSERFIVALDSYKSNMNFSIPMDDRTRTQFALEFKKFLTHSLEFFETSTKFKQGINIGNVDVIS